MRKTPILLSTLTLMLGASGITNAAMLSQSTAAAETNLEQGAVQDLYFDDLYAMSEYFRISKIDFEQGFITVELGHTSPTEWSTPQRLLIVMRDYEAGVTEAKANEAVKTLGSGDTSWYKVMFDSKTSQMQLASTNYIYPRTTKLEDNLPDVLYFALQYGHKTVSASGVQKIENKFWVRGKIDYRKCLHSPSFDAKTMTCGVEIDSVNQTAELVGLQGSDYIHFAEDENFLTWEEELKTAVRQRIKDLKAQLNNLPDLGVVIFQTNKAVNNMEESLDGMSQASDIDKGIDEIRTMLEDLQYTSDWALGAKQQEKMDNLKADFNAAQADLELANQQSLANAEALTEAQKDLEEITKKWQEAQNKLGLSEEERQEELAELLTAQADLKVKLAQMQAETAEITAEKEQIMQKMQELSSESAELSEQKGQLEQENDELRAENASLKAENADLKAANTELATQNEALMAKIKELETKLAEKPVCTMVGEVQVGEEPLEEAATQPEAREITVQVDTEAVEVPNLGEVETKTNFWWVVVAIIGAIGVLGLCCKKRIERD